MIAALAIFEDPGWRKLRPLTDTLPVPALAFGASTLAGRWLAATGLPLAGLEARADAVAAWHGRPATVRGGFGADAELLAVNAAALPGPWLDEALAAAGPGAWHAGGALVAARLPATRAEALLGSGAEFAGRVAALGLPAREADAARLEYPWHLVERNAQALAADLGRDGGNAGDVHPSAVLLSPGRVRIAAGARVDPHVVLDAREGPVSIGPGCVLQAHTRVVGPCAVGAGTHLLGGVIAGSTIGPDCRLAGEVEASIFQGWANKRHHGFVGHSVVGEWVNLGALTTTSDLKNNYGAVRVWVDGAEVDSGNPKVGAVIGAHVKTGIGSLLPTGASVGVGANLFGGGRFAPKRTPAFAWWDGERSVPHEIEKFLATARHAMARRGRALGAADEALLRALFAATAPERA